jgi:flagellar biosynthesis protein FlhB
VSKKTSPAPVKETASPPSYTDSLKALEESLKLRYDSYKHLTTLNAGSILLITTFLEKLFVSPKWKGLVGVALGMFVISIILCFRLMNTAAHFVMLMDIPPAEGRSTSLIAAICAFCFVWGLIFMAIFAMKNLYW